MAIPAISSSWGWGSESVLHPRGFRMGFSSPQPWLPVRTGELTVDGADSNQWNVIYGTISGSEMAHVCLLSNSQNAEEPSSEQE